MTADAKHFVDELKALPDVSKREVFTEIIRRSRDLDDLEPSENESASVADALFLEYDRQESGE